MRICITCSGSTLDSQIDPRFGRAQYFLIIDEKGKLKETIENPGVSALRGAGITAAQLIADKKVEVIITGNIGPNAFGVLKTTGVKIFLAPANLSVKETFEKWENNELKEIESATGPGRFGIGRGFGRGQGFGRGNT